MHLSAPYPVPPIISPKADFAKQSTVNTFAVIGAVATVVSVILAACFGYRSISAPGVKVEGMPELTRQVRTGNDLTTDIRDAVVPADPIEALSKRGYNWTRRYFKRALEMQDDISMDLFCNAGPRGVFPGSLSMLWTTADVATDRIFASIDCPAFDAASVCSSETPFGADA